MLNLSNFTIHCDIIKLNITEHCFLLSGFNLSILFVNNILNIFTTSFNLFRSPWLKFVFFFLKHQSVLETVYAAVSDDLHPRENRESSRESRLATDCQLTFQRYCTVFCSQWCTGMKPTSDKPPGFNWGSKRQRPIDIQLVCSGCLLWVRKHWFRNLCLTPNHGVKQYTTSVQQVL